MKKLAVLLVTTIVSFSSFAATEISKNEAKDLIKVGEIEITDRTFKLCSDKISKIADEKGAEYYVITGFLQEGNGDNISVSGDLYSKKTGK